MYPFGTWTDLDELPCTGETRVIVNHRLRNRGLCSKSVTAYVRTYVAMNSKKQASTRLLYVAMFMAMCLSYRHRYAALGAGVTAVLY